MPQRSTILLNPSLTTFVNLEKFGANSALADNSSAIQAALDTGDPILIPPKTFNYATQVRPSQSGQLIIGSGKLSNLNFTGTGYAFAFLDVSRCTMRDIKITTADEGIDFKIAASNCLNNLVENVLISGPGRGATSTTTSRHGVTFRRMIGGLAVFFNTIRDCTIENLDVPVWFDAPAGAATTGGNANNCFNIHMEHFWKGYDIRSVENRIDGGFFNQASGNSAVDYVVGYKFTNSCSYNVVYPAVGEPGTNCKPFEMDAGTGSNFLQATTFNFDMAGTDAGTANITGTAGTFSAVTVLGGIVVSGT